MPPSTTPQTRTPKRPLGNTFVLLLLWAIFLRQLHAHEPRAARRRRLRPCRGGARDAPAPRLGHPLRQRHSLPGEGAASLLVDGRQLQALRRQRCRSSLSACADRSGARLRGGDLRAAGLSQCPRRPLCRAHPALQLRIFPLHPHPAARRDALPLAHPRPPLFLAKRRMLLH